MTISQRCELAAIVNRINSMLKHRGINRKLMFNGENGLIAVRIHEADETDGAAIKTISYRNFKDTKLFLESFNSGMEIMDAEKQYA